MRITLLTCFLVALAPSLVGAGTTRSTEGIRFAYKNDAARQVFLAGSFNDWNQTTHPMPLEGDHFAVTLKLKPGEYEYKFVVDGNFLADPDNPTTIGSFGNSALRVGALGEILSMEATSNTPLSPKILLHGRYIALFLGREDEENQDRFGVSRPDFNIDLDFDIRVSSAMEAKVLTKIRNVSEETPLWETSLRFDRGHLLLKRPDFTVRFFDNLGVRAWGDPLDLLGNVGKYERNFGFEQQGVDFNLESHGFRGRLLYSDNFEIGDPNTPALDTLAVGTIGDRYDFNSGDSNKNVFALRLEKPVASDWVLGVGLRLDRGTNPGNLTTVRSGLDSLTLRKIFTSTNQQSLGGGFDVHWRTAESSRWSAYGELLLGESWINSGAGVTQEFVTGSASPRNQTAIQSERFTLDVSQRWIIGGNVQWTKDLSFHAGLESQRHGLASVATDSARTFINKAFVYRLGFNWDLEKSFGLPIRLGTDLEVFDFSYSNQTPWSSQLWFADNNFWLEHDAHQLPVSRYVQLGSDEATTWSPWLEWAVLEKPDIQFRYDGNFRGNKISRSIELWESHFKLRHRVSPAVRLFSHTRWVRYQDAGLGVDGGWVSTFAEVEYSFSPTVAVAFSFGVDPHVLDLVTNQYDEIGYNEFLLKRGATPNFARDNYLNLRTVLPAAEQALADERVVQLEAVMRF